MKQFKFQGTKIIIPEAIVRYNELKVKYKKIAIEAEKEFRNIYIEENKNIEDVIQNAFDQGNKIIENVVMESDDIDFRRISESNFIEHYYLNYLLDWQEAYNVICEKYMDIVLKESEKDTYRKYRKETRGRWQGGGFGIKGAVTGAVQAGAMNMASGAIHSTFNVAGKMVSGMMANRKKSKLFREKSTLDSLATELHDAICNLHLAVAQYIKDTTGNEIMGASQYGVDLVARRLQKLVNSNTDDEYKIEELAKIVEIYPYSESIYQYMIQEFGDSNNEVQIIAEYFGCDVYKYKEKVLDEKFKKLSTESEEKTKESKEIIINEIERLGLPKNQNYIDILDKKLEEYDIQVRTVNEILFDTREEALKARQEVEKIESITSNIDNEDLESLKLGLEALKSLDLEEKIVNPYLDGLESKINKIELEKRTIYIKPLEKYKYKINDKKTKKIIFDTIDEADVARREQELIESWHKEVELTQLFEKVENEIQTEIKEIYITQINEIRESIKKSHERKVKLYDPRKETVRKYILWSPLFFIVALGCFSGFGLMGKVIVAFIVYIFTFNLIESVKDYNESKKAKSFTENVMN